MRRHKTYQPIDLNALQLISIKERKHKVRLEDLALPAGPDAGLAEFFESLPSTPVTAGLRELSIAIVRATKADSPVVMAFGAHVIKCGLGPVIIDLLERGIVTAVRRRPAT